MRNIQAAYNSDTEYYQPHIPERILLLAVFERYVADLKTGSGTQLRNALNWFKTPERYTGLTFELVLETFDFSAARIRYINELISNGEQRVDFNYKGEQTSQGPPPSIQRPKRTRGRVLRNT